MNFLIQDIRIGLRSLLKSPGFTGIAILTLALGIGANTAIFSILNSLLFRPLPVENPDQLVVLANKDKHMEFPHGLSYVDYMDFREKSDIFSDLSIYTPFPMSISGEGRAVRTWGMVVSGSYFPMLGVEAYQGNTFSYDDAIYTGGEQVLVLGYRFWQRTYAGDPAIVGKTLEINGATYTVLGIMPEGFNGTETILDLDLYIPLSTVDQLRDLGEELFVNRESHTFRSVGRLLEGVSAEQAQTAMQHTVDQLAGEYPDTNAGINIIVVREKDARPEPSSIGLMKPISLAFMALVSLVLFIACANVANLLLARGTSRSKEIATRAALGAGRIRIIRQLLTETLLLTLIGCGIGIMIAEWATAYVASIGNNLPGDIPVNIDISPDGRVYVFAVIAAVVACIVAGLVPALQTSKVNLLEAMKEGRTSTAGQGRHLIRKVLVVSQLAVSLLLLICAGLFMQSLMNAQNMNMGFRADNLLLASVDPATQGYDEEKCRQIFDEIVERVSTLPGVESASIAGFVPFSGVGIQVANIFVVGGDVTDEREAPSVFFNAVDHHYFKTMGISILSGRDFTELDLAEAENVVVINETMANQRWPGEDALGKQFRFDKIDGDLITVVGICQDGKYMFLAEDPRPFMYRPLTQSMPLTGTLQVRTEVDPMSLATAVRTVVSEIDDTLPLYGVGDMKTHLSGGNALMPIRLAAMMVGSFGLLGLALATIGIYGVIAYSVGCRTHEFGIRMALGASGSEVLRLVFREGMVLTVIGVVVGLAFAFAGTRLLGSMLLGVNPNDIVLYALVTALLVVISLLACFIPAYRATRVDPMVALRYE